MLVSDSAHVADTAPELRVADLHVRLLLVNRQFLRSDQWNFDTLSGSHWRLYQNDSPGASLVFGETIFALEPHEVYLIPAGLTLGSRNAAAFTQFYVHFDVIGLPHLALEELFGGPVRVPSSPQFQDAVARLGSGWGLSEDPLVDQCLVKGIVYEALGRYLREAPAVQRERWGLRLSRLKPVLPAIQKIDENPGAKIVVKDLAGACHMSEDHFIRRFRACTGLSPMQYVMDRRVALAAQRLLFTEETLEQIAATAGFGNRYYFTRVFTRHAGQPPATFRKGAR